MSDDRRTAGVPCTRPGTSGSGAFPEGHSAYGSVHDMSAGGRRGKCCSKDDPRVAEWSYMGRAGGGEAIDHLASRTDPVA